MDNLPEFEGRVRGLSSEGLGVVEDPQGRVFFVRGVWPGDKGRFLPTRLEKRYGYASLQALTEPSPDRVTAPCPHQGYVARSCGGCPWMIGNYESQLRAKSHRVQHALERATLLTNESVLKPIWGSEPWGYRNRAQFKTDGKNLGFVSDESHVIAPIQDCLVLIPPLREKLRGMLGSMPRTDWAPTEDFDWCFLEIDEQMSPTEPPWLNKRRPFLQGNTAMNERMRGWIHDRLEDDLRSDPILELFCGSGNFTEVVAKMGFQQVLACEASEAAVNELKQKKLHGVVGRVCDLYHPASLRILARDAQIARTLILDPPRTGAKGVERLVSDLHDLKKILYVSCDVATFVRDAVALKAAGFKLREVQPLDLFPHTAHVEVMGEFVR